MFPSRLSVFAWTAALVLTGVRPLAAGPGLTLGPNATVLKDGKPWHGVGVNYFSCFTRTLGKPGDTSYEAGFAVLAQQRIPFARFCATGFWPSEMQLYLTNRAEYFRRLDGVVRSAEKHAVGLVPSLFWYYACVPDLVGEPMDCWGKPGSKTIAFLREYTREVVTRYKDSPAIWAWEFGNEYFLGADLPNATQHRPPVWTNLGTASERTSRDELTHDMITMALTEFGKEVRRHDSARLITSGDAFPRDCAWHNRREKKWTKDTPEQCAEMLALSAPAPLDLISIHCYEENLGKVSQAAAVAARLSKPLFVGEFQVPRAETPTARKAFGDFLAALAQERVALAAVWVFDFGAQEGEFNITGNASVTAGIALI